MGSLARQEGDIAYKRGALSLSPLSSFLQTEESLEQEALIYRLQLSPFTFTVPEIRK